MPSRRRSANKNIGNNIAEVNRRLRFLERRPVKTKLGLRSVTGANVANSAITPDQVTFGTNIVTTDTNLVAAVENPKDGLVVTNPSTGQTQVYSEDYNSYIPVSDPTAAGFAFDAYDFAGSALEAANNAQASAQTAFDTADGKNKIFYASSAPTSTSSYTLKNGDLWFNSAQGYRLSQYGTGGWTLFQLGSKAIDKIEANQILAGTIVAGMSITAPTLNGGVINAGRLNGGEVYGAFIATSETGPRLTISDSDTISFYGNSGLLGTISPLKVFGGGESYGLFFSRPDFADYIQIQDFVIEARNSNFDGWSIHKTPIVNDVTLTIRSSGAMQIESDGGYLIYDNSTGLYEQAIFMDSNGVSLQSTTLGISIDGPLRVGFSLYSSTPTGTGLDGEIRFVYG